MEFRKLFENDYAGYEVILNSLVKPVFGEKIKERNQDIEIESQDAKSIKNMKIFASLGGAFPINFVDVTIKDNVKLEHNRVTVQRCVRKIMLELSSALIFFHYENTANTSWRITFVNKGEKATDSTNPKRYTYLCGKKLSCRTCSERFSVLQSEIACGKKVLDELMVNAFSVETVSNEFFEEYKAFYEDFVQYITGSRYVKKGNKYEKTVIHKPNTVIFREFLKRTNDNEEDGQKLVRDYIKKMMGRLVFLQFLQKKKWMGVEFNDDDWVTGDSNFIYSLFINSSNDEQNKFLDTVLEPLFFGMLNTPKEERKQRFKNEGWNLELLDRFKKIPYLNGGLFAKDELDEIKIKFPKEMFCNFGKEDVIRKFLGNNEKYDYKASSGLLDFFNRYNFTIDESDPNDVEVGVDPEMLGKIFENLLEDNKDKGAFYTPKEIVNYMCRESLLQYLITEVKDIDEKDLRTFVETQNLSEKIDSEKKNALIKALEEVKICDPAVGSGAFPMGLLNLLFACRHSLVGEEKMSRAEIKMHIVQNSIYGVDIEKGAVDIARLRFWLSIVVDAEKPEPLPNLDYKIMQGNSLLESYKGTDLSHLLTHETTELFDADTDKIQSLQKAINEYYLPEDHKAKEKIEKQIKETVLSILTDRYPDPKIFKDLKELDLKANTNFFLWHTWFSDVFNRPEKNGFDIVIGNPPYIKEYENKDAFNHFRDSSPYYMGKMDLWYGFACHSLDLLCNKGHVCFIAHNNWTTSKGAKLLRKKVINDSKIIQLLDFNTYMVFENASIQTMIMLFEKNNTENNYVFDYRTLQENSVKQDMLELLKKHKTDKTNYLNPKINRQNLAGKLLTFSGNEAIFEKIANEKVYLDDKEATNGIHTHHDFVNKKIHNSFPQLPLGKGIFVLTDDELKSMKLSKNEMNLIKPYFISDEISRYYTDKKNENWIIYTTSDFKDGVEIKKYQKIKEHLDSVKLAITSDNKPYGLHRAREEHFFKGEKIISQRKCVEKPVFSYNNFDCYVPAMYYIIQTSRWNMKFLTGVLNSKLIAFWLKNKGKMQGSNYQVDKEPLLSIPLPNPKNILEAQQQKIIAIVDQILAIKKSDSSADTTALESQIDQLVYKLYNLTDEEIKIVEEKK